MNLQFFAVKQSVAEPCVSSPIPGREEDMARNASGAFSFVTKDLEQLKRFLIIGTESGTCYVDEDILTIDNIVVLDKLLNSDNYRQCIDIIEEVSCKALSPKVSYTLFALARALSHDKVEVKQYAARKVNRVCRTFSHLAEMVNYATTKQRGWGSLMKRTVANWYNDKSISELTTQVIKYRDRKGFTHKDMLRLSHAYTADSVRFALYNYCMKDILPVGYEDHEDLSRIFAFEKVKYLFKDNKDNISTVIDEMIKLIDDYRLPFECIPTELLTNKEILIKTMKYNGDTAFIRSLNKLTAYGCLETDKQYIESRFFKLDPRISPFSILLAYYAYSAGRGVKGNLTWTPDENIINLLERNYKHSLTNPKDIELKKKIAIFLDVSSSMDVKMGQFARTVSVRQVAANIASVLCHSHPNVDYVYLTAMDLRKIFKAENFPAGISEASSYIEDIVETMRTGGTNLALPMRDLLDNNINVDGIIFLTDNEANTGSHFASILNNYRKTINPDLRFVNLAMTAGESTIVDPKDSLSLGLSGLDSSCLKLALDFIEGKF